MHESSTRARTRVFRLPVRVDGRALESVLGEMAGAVASACVLDFAVTIHIDFRALQRFAVRVRNLGAVVGPIHMVGLNAYCEEIVRFALSTQDWDLFVGAASTAASVPGGSGTEAVWTGNSGLDRIGAVRFDLPCPN